MARRRHPFLDKKPQVGKVSPRHDGERPTGEPNFNLEDQEGVLWKKARNGAAAKTPGRGTRPQK